MKRMTVKKLRLNGLSALLLLSLAACGELDDNDSGGVYRQTDYDPWYGHNHIYYDDDWYDVPPYAPPGGGKPPEKPDRPGLKPTHPIMLPGDERPAVRPSTRRAPSIPSRARPSFGGSRGFGGGGFGGGGRGGGGRGGGGRR